MTFLAPGFLLSLAALPPLALVLARGGARARQSARLLQGGPDAPPDRRLSPRDGRTLAALACMILALARPAWNPRSATVSGRERDLVFALDISRSMLAADVPPNRIEAARIAIHEALDSLRGRRIGLVTFAGAASVRVPLTLDHAFVRHLLEQAGPTDASVGSTSLQSAIEKAIHTVFRTSTPGGQDLVIFTDGEDHISDIKKTSDLLRDSEARVLIIGLGDETTGARVPAPGDEGGWMQYEGADVVSRLDEATLQALAAASPNVRYHKAGTRPFDFRELYLQWLRDAPPGPPVETEEPVHTEGWPAALAAALALWLLPWLPRPRALLPAAALAALLATGCAPRRAVDAREFERRRQEASGKETEAAKLPPGDADAVRSLLEQAREDHLLAALLDPGNAPCARDIARLTARIRALDEVLRRQREEEEQQRQSIEAALEALQELTARQEQLAHDSQQMVRRRPPAPAPELAAAAPPAQAEETAIRAGTGPVLETLRHHQSLIRSLLARVFDNPAPAQEPRTEFDEAVSHLDAAVLAQGATESSLGAQPPDWPAANSSALAAARRMRQALESLASGSPPPDGEGEPGDSGEMDDESEMEWADNAEDANQSLPMKGGNFKTALEARSLPTPNYTAEDILVEEASNQQERARHRESRAGAGVEKNW